MRSDSVNLCPLRTPPFERVFDDFYFNKVEYSHQIRPYSVEDRGLNKQITKWEALPRLISFKDKWWRLGKIFRNYWEEGLLHNKNSNGKMVYISGYPAHFHTNLTVFDESFHIDFYGIAYRGPGSSLKEIRVYRGEELIARGGRGNVSFCGFVQNLPFVVPVEDSILLFQYFVHSFDKVDLDISISLWHRCTNLHIHKITSDKNQFQDK